MLTISACRYSPTLITVMPANDDPFLAKGAFARNPEDARSEDNKNKWRLVMSYAWAIFRRATEEKEGPDVAELEAWHNVKNTAREWGNDFLQTFNPLYVDIVLPACDLVIGDFQDRLVRHLAELWETVEGTDDALQMKHILVSLQSVDPPVN